MNTLGNDVNNSMRQEGKDGIFVYNVSWQHEELVGEFFRKSDEFGAGWAAVDGVGCGDTVGEIVGDLAHFL
jgi:hypothetical protein